MDLKYQNDLNLNDKRQFNDGQYRGVGSSTGDTRGSTSPPSSNDKVTLPNELGSSDNLKSNDKSESSSESDNVRVEKLDDDDDVDDNNDDNDDTIDNDDDEVVSNEEDKGDGDNSNKADDDDENGESTKNDDTVPPSSNNNNSQDSHPSIDSGSDFKVAYLSPIFIIGGLVALFTIMGLIYRKRRRSRLAKERAQLDNEVPQTHEEYSKSDETILRPPFEDDIMRHSSWQTNDDAELMSPNHQQTYYDQQNSNPERPWNYQPSGLSPRSFRNEPWKWSSIISNEKTYVQIKDGKPFYHHTNSSFQPPSQLADEFLKSPLPEGFHGVAHEDVDRNFDEYSMDDEKRQNSGSMAFYANAMKSALDGEKYVKGNSSIRDKILSRNSSPHAKYPNIGVENQQNSGDGVRQRKTSDKHAQQVQENDEHNYIPSTFSPPLRSSTPWGGLTQVVRTVFNPPKREPTPSAFGGFFRRAPTPANPLAKQLNEVPENSEQNVLTPISKDDVDLKSPVAVTLEPSKTESTSDDHENKVDEGAPPPPLPKSPDKHAKRGNKKGGKVSKDNNKKLQNFEHGLMSPTSPIVMNAIVDESANIKGTSDSKEKLPHSPLLEQLTQRKFEKSAVVSPKFPTPYIEEVVKQNEKQQNEVKDDVPQTNKSSPFYTVKDVKNIRNVPDHNGNYVDEAAKLRNMAITPFVKPPLSINIPQSVDMKQTESQLTPPGLPSAVEQPNEQQQQTNEQKVMSPKTDIMMEEGGPALPFAPSPPPLAKKMHIPSWSLEAQAPRVVSPPPNVISPPPMMNLNALNGIEAAKGLPETLRSPPPHAIRSELIYQGQQQQQSQSIGSALASTSNNYNNNSNENENENVDDDVDIETWSEGSGSTVFYEDETYQDDGIINIGRQSGIQQSNNSIGGGSTKSRIKRIKTRRSAMTSSTKNRSSQMTAPPVIEENNNNNGEQQSMMMDGWKQVEENRGSQQPKQTTATNTEDQQQHKSPNTDEYKSPQSEEFASPISNNASSNQSPSKSEFKSPKSDDFKSVKSDENNEFKSPKNLNLDLNFNNTPQSQFSDFLPTIEATPELARSGTMKNYLMRLPSFKQSAAITNNNSNQRSTSSPADSIGRLASPNYSNVDFSLDFLNSNKKKTKDESITSNYSKISKLSSKHDEDHPGRANHSNVDDILTSSWSSRISSDDIDERPPKRRGAAVAPRTRRLLEARMRRERSGSPNSSLNSLQD